MKSLANSVDLNDTAPLEDSALHHVKGLDQIENACPFPEVGSQICDAVEVTSFHDGPVTTLLSGTQPLPLAASFNSAPAPLAACYMSRKELPGCQHQRLGNGGEAGATCAPWHALATL